MKRKTRQELLEKQRRIFFLIGLIISLSAVLAAFEWKTYDISMDGFVRTDHGVVDFDLAPITKHEKPKPPEPIFKPALVIKGVDDNTDVPDIVLFNPESDPTDSIPEFVYDPVDEPDGVTEDIVFKISEDMPEFPGGQRALMAYLSSKVKYTQMAREAAIQGIVYVQFIVEKDGSVSTVELLRGLGGGLDEIALEVVRSMPDWSPGKQRGVPVRVAMTVPFKFKLQ